MAKFYLIRHGSVDYDKVTEKGFIGHGIDLAPLSEKGVMQITQSAGDDRLKNCNILISSPYTRTMQSASILSLTLNLPINVEVNLHEWLPDNTYSYRNFDEMVKNWEEFNDMQGIKPINKEVKWEDRDSIRQRAKAVLKRYDDNDAVLVVCHYEVILSLTDSDKYINYGEIFEYELQN